MDEQIQAIKDLHEAELLDITVDDRQAIRDIAKLPRLTKQKIIDIEKKREVNEIKEEKKEKKENQNVFKIN